MPEIDNLIRELHGPEAPITGLRIPHRKPRFASMAVAALLAACVAIWAWPTRHVGQRGAGSGVDLDLRMIVSRDGRAFRVSQGATYHPGESVYFRVAASRVVTTWLWVEGPMGRESIARFKAAPEPEDVRQDGGLVAYLFDATGSYTFFLATQDGTCEVEGCRQLSLEVR